MIKLSKIDVYKCAYDFWNTELHRHDEVTWDEFMIHFIKYIKQNAKFQLDDDQMRNLRNLLDPNLNMSITMREFLIFYERHWNNIHDRRKILKEGIPFPPIFEKQQFSYELKLTVEKAPKNSTLREEETLKFTKLDLPSLIQEATLDKTFGKEGCDYVLVKKANMDYQDQLFRITPFLGGFKVKCNERNKRLKFKVENRPYILLPGMVIQIGLNSLFKVSTSNPLPRDKHIEFYTLFSFEKDKFFEYLNEQTVQTPEEYDLQFLKFRNNYANKLAGEKEFIRLECIKGPEKGQIFDLNEKLTIKQLRYSFGRIKSMNEVHLSDVTVSSTHCTISYHRNVGWTIEELSPSAFGTYILLPTYEQYKNGSASYPHEIQDGMKLSVDEYVFKSEVKRTDERLENMKAKYQNTKSV